MSLILWLLCVLGTTLALALRSHPALVGALAVFIAAPILSWGTVLGCRKKLSICWTAPGVTQKKKPFTLGVRLESKTGLPVGKTVAWLQLTNTATGQTQRKRISFRGNREYTLESSFCGCIECKAESLWCYDLFGVLPVKLSCRQKKRILVMPGTFPVEVSSVLTQSRVEAAEYSPDRKGYDRSETFQIRDYVPGDSLQQIHWKLSSKMGELVVRDASLPVDRELMVFLDQTDPEQTPEQTDALLEAVISVSQALTEAGLPFTLAWNGDTIHSYEIGSSDCLMEAVSALLKAGTVREGISGAELYQKTGEPVGAVLYFCSTAADHSFPASAVQVFVCGETAVDGAVSFTAETMAETLGAIRWS